MENYHEITQKISFRIKQLRKEKNLTQEKLSQLSGVDYKHIQLLESKKAPAVRIDTLEKICIGLNISLSNFFKEEFNE